MLHEFINANRQRIIGLACEDVAAKSTPSATAAEVSHGLPVFLDQLVEALTSTGQHGLSIEQSAGDHGVHLMRAGFTCAQVVHDYGNICQAITKLAGELDASITPEEFRTLNRCLDDAIAGAITQYTRLREDAIDQVGAEHLGALVRSLHAPLAAARLTYRVLKSGTVAISGSTGTQLGRNLRRVSALVDRAMARVRLDAGAQSPERMNVFEFIEEVSVGAVLEASARGLSFSVRPGERDVDIEVDRQLLTAAVSNLVQNALQFTRARGHIALTASSAENRVCIHVADECGGLPLALEAALLGAFAPPGAPASPLGAGLTIVRRSVEAIGATLGTRNDPGEGCTFTLCVPKMPRR